jgi:Subtilase family
LSYVYFTNQVHAQFFLIAFVVIGGYTHDRCANQPAFMRNFYMILLASALLVAACKKQNELSSTKPEWKVAPKTSVTDLDQLIKTNLIQTGKFEWNAATNEQVWAAISNTDYIVSVGYKPAALAWSDDQLGRANLQDADYLNAFQQLQAVILESERKLNPALVWNDLLYHQNELLPNFNVRVFNPATVQVLRASKMVRYAEPTAYEPFHATSVERSSSGCGGNTVQSGLTTPADYTAITPTAKQSWNHSYHKITQAWANSTGAGTRVVIIDTGSSDAQENLSTAFNQGSSSGRSVSRLVTLPQATNIWGNPTGSPETPNDLCGHGTSMSGACAAPRGTDGNSVGVAYNCNLTVYRAAADVYLDESREVVGVSTAFTQAGANSSVKIISMSMGRLNSSSQISDAITYAYNQGKLVFCAAGTSFSWTAWFTGVIFPASMTQAVAVTGIKTNLTSRCSACHDGSKVDFIVVMEKTDGGASFPLSLADDFDTPSTVGGSSVATATTAGIAALVWSKYPNWTRAQVFDRLKTSANYFPTRNSSHGWGRINAQLATQ